MKSDIFSFIGSLSQQFSGRLDLPEGPVRGYAVFAHCFTCSKNSLAAVRIASALASRGLGVLRFDFTGLGESDGEFGQSTFSGNVQDLLAAAAAMEAAGMPPDLLIGHSLGGAAVLAAVAQTPTVKAVATIGAPFDVQHVTRLFGENLQKLLQEGEAQVQLGGRPFNIRRAFVDDRAAHDQRERISTLKRPLLVLHAPKDDTVGIENATSIFKSALHPKSFVSLDDADHRLTRPHDAAYCADVIAAWVSRYLGRVESAPRTEVPGHVSVQETGAVGLQVEARTGGFSFLSDEPVAAGGLGSGPTTYELLSAALGACTAMTLRLYARRKGWPMGGVRVEVEHARAIDTSPPDVFRRTVSIDGELTAEQRARQAEIADRYPVHRTLERGSRTETRHAD